MTSRLTIDAANDAGSEAVATVIREAAAQLALHAGQVALIESAGHREAGVRRPATLEVPEGDASQDFSRSLDFGVVLDPVPGKFNPRVIQLRLSPLIASVCGAVGATMAPLPVLGWAMVGIAAAIALRDFWKKTVIFDGVHGQLLFEMFRSTDSGKAHAIPVDHLFANVNGARIDAGSEPLARPAFELALNFLASNGILGWTPEGSLEWAEMAVEIDA